MNLVAGGTRLHVEVAGPQDADLTVVLAHGWTQSARTWRYQVRDLAAAVGAPVRVVAYDHRGHGRSDPTPEHEATVENLAADLGRVTDELAGDGPVVLAGHSMGGMAVMELARQRPGLFGDRVVGAVLVSTSPGRLDRVTLGLPDAMGARVRRRLPRLLAARARRLSRRTRRRAPALESQVVRRMLLGRPMRVADHATVLADLVATPPDSMCGFFTDLMTHDRRDCLDVLASVRTHVLVGERDRLTPVSHARRMGRAMPWARLSVLPDAGHMLPLERDRVVTHAIAAAARGDRPSVGADHARAETAHAEPTRA